VKRKGVANEEKDMGSKRSYEEGRERIEGEGEEDKEKSEWARRGVTYLHRI
jgi:hypothetical protein